jgi:glycosyltransferase involved in cell wall biosynthesis
MKVVRIIARLNVGGPARHVVWLAQGLRDAGHQAVLVTGVLPPGEDDMSYVAREAGLTPVVLSEMSREISPKDINTVWRLYRLLRRERPDIVHTHTAKAGTVGRVAGIMYRWLTPAALLGKPRQCHFVHTYHGHVFHSYYGPLKTKLFLAIERTLARFTDRILVLSDQQLNEINERFCVGRREQFRVIPLGIDVRAFGENNERRPKLRRELGLSDTDVLVGIVGRLTEVKNHQMFLQAVAKLKETLAPDSTGKAGLRFLVIGDGHLRPQLESQAAQLGLDREVLFLGSRNDPEDFYAALDIVALTSLNEGTPLTLIEGMANARPAIATVVGGVVDLLGDCEADARGTGFTICERGIGARSNDVEAFADGLKFLIQHEDQRRLMGDRGRTFVERGYSKTRLINDVINLYEELLGSRSAPATKQSEEMHVHT